MGMGNELRKGWDWGRILDNELNEGTRAGIKIRRKCKGMVQHQFNTGHE